MTSELLSIHFIRRHMGKNVHFFDFEFNLLKMSENLHPPKFPGDQTREVKGSKPLTPSHFITLN